jgi:hypothetical protein
MTIGIEEPDARHMQRGLCVGERRGEETEREGEDEPYRSGRHAGVLLSPHEIPCELKKLPCNRVRAALLPLPL